MKHRHIALFTALTLLCGCSGNTEVSTSSEAVTAPETTAQLITQEPEAPAGVTDIAYTTEIPTDTTTASNAAGINLEAGDWTKYDNTFKLNGTWCDPEELPVSKFEYQLPEKFLEKDISYSFGNGTMYLSARNKVNSTSLTNDPLEVWYIDLSTGEEKLVYSGQEGDIHEYVDYAGEKYLGIERVSGNGTEFVVADALTGNELYKFPTDYSDNIRLAPESGAYAVYDTMYVSGEYTLPDLKKSVDAIFTLDLLTGKIDLFGINMSQPAYGSGNLCWQEGNTITNLFGETWGTNDFDCINIERQTVSRNMKGSYYTTTEVQSYTDVLGFKTALYWTIHDFPNDFTQRFIGETGYSVYPYDLYFTQNCIFSVWLGNYYGKTDKLLLGKFDKEADNSQAALLSIPDAENVTVYADKNAVYLMNFQTGNVTMYSGAEGDQGRSGTVR